MLNPEQTRKVRLLLNVFYLNGNPAGDAMSQGQLEIAAAIILKLNPRIANVAPTGYGKSEAVAMGVIYRACVFKEDWVVSSVKYGTSDIIMKKILEHIFDDKMFFSQLEVDASMKLSELKRERNKRNINFKKGGSIKVVSLYGADMDISAAIGEHAENQIIDESPLLTPTKYLQVLKILEGTGDYDSTFLFELGNAVNRNHFMYNVKHNPKYLKIDISLEQAIAERRLDPRSVDEKRGLPFFEQFYECKFPDEDEIDEKGYRVLLTDSDIDNAFTTKDAVTVLDDDLALGVDIAGGGDYNVFCLRNSRTCTIIQSNRSNDTMTNVTEIERLMDEWNIKAGNVFIDDIGIGRGVSDRLKEKGHEINSISVGEKSTEPERFKNLKAECYWELRMWIKGGGKLLRDERFRELTQIKYKINSDKVLQIEPKEDLKKRIGKSPDHAEALMLTFAPKQAVPGIAWV